MVSWTKVARLKSFSGGGGTWGGPPPPFISDGELSLFERGSVPRLSPPPSTLSLAVAP